MAVASAPRLYDAGGVEIPLSGTPGPNTKRIPAGVESEVNDRYRGYPSRQLTINRILEITEEADAGDPYRLIELLEEMVEKDGKIESVLKARTAAVVGLNWDVLPAQLPANRKGETEKAIEIARFCQEALASTNYRQLYRDLMGAAFKPFAVDWITWGENADGKIVPQTFSKIPTKHIRWAYKKNEIRVYQPSKPGQMVDGEWGSPLPPFTTVRAIDMSRDDDPTRAGVGRTLLVPYQLKLSLIKYMVQYAERYGIPPRVLKIDEQDFDNSERYQKFRAAMRDFGQDLSAVISKNSDLELEVVATNDGVMVFIGQIDYFDKWMAWKVLGHELTSQSSPGQGQLGITAAMDVKQEYKEDDCNRTSEAINLDVFTPLVGWNYGWDAVAAGLVPSHMFDYELPRDLQGQSQVLDRIVRLFPDLTLSKADIRDTYGITPPRDEEDAEEDDVLRAGTIGADAAAGASGADDPFDGDEEEPDAEPTSVNSARAQGGLRITFAEDRPAPAVQKPVDTLVKRGTARAAKTTDGWARQLRALLKQAVTDGLTFGQARQRVVEAYPELDVADLDKTLREQILLTRLHGRNS